MNNFNYKNWSIQQEIKKRVNMEALVEWAQNYKPMKIPKVKKVEKVEFTAGVYTFLRELLP